MSTLHLQSLLALIFGMALLSSVSALAEEAKPLTVEEAKFQMFQLYSEAKLPQTKLRTKYPAVRKADKAARDARREYSKAIKAHPDLKEEFDKIDQLKVSIPEKMKFQRPLFEKAETLASLEDIRTKYHQARILALKEEVSALRSERHTELADRMTAILHRVKQGAPKDQS